MDPRAYNRQAWDRQVEKGNRWTVPAGGEAVARARTGDGCPECALANYMPVFIATRAMKPGGSQ